MKLSEFKKIDLPFHGVRLPSFEIEDKTVSSNFDFLVKLCYDGYEEKLKRGEIPTSESEKYIERIKYELDTLDGLGFTDYILLIWDVINFCKKAIFQLA